MSIKYFLNSKRYYSMICAYFIYWGPGGIIVYLCLFQAVKLEIPVLEEVSDSDIKSKLLSNAPASAQE